MLTTRPQPRRFMPGTNAEGTRNTLSRLIAISRRQSAKVMASNGCWGKMPAQLITMSTRPKRRSTSPAMAATASGEGTAHGAASARPPAQAPRLVRRGDVGDDDVDAILGEPPRKRLPDAVGGAGDDRDLALVPV